MWRTLRTVLIGAVLVIAVVAIGLGRTLTEPPGDPVDCDDPVAWDQADARVGESAAVEGPVAEVTWAQDVGGAPTFLNLGAPHPDEPRFDVVVYADVREAIAFDLHALEGEGVCAAGTIGQRDGVAQIVVAHPAGLERHEGAGP